MAPRYPPAWMPLLQAIEHVRGVEGGTLEDACASLLVALSDDGVESRYRGNHQPIDPTKWYEAKVWGDGAVLFRHVWLLGDPANPAVLHVEVLRSDVLQHWPDLAETAIEAPSKTDVESEKVGEAGSAGMRTGTPSKARPGPIPTRDGIETAAKALIAAERVPARTITWKQFRMELCKFLNVKPEQRGYSLDTIQTVVRPLLLGAQVNGSAESTEN
jgi:hypothetical protein